MQESLTKEKRIDIQLLRAIAVLSVVVFHINPLAAPSGYLGVDVFFVISGFLITKNLIRLRIENRPLIEFYRGRIYRLFPAVLTVVVISLFLGYFLMNPFQQADTLKSGVYSLFSLSNLYFVSSAGYFDVESISKPFLHTWSLAVEEQFYLVWPIFITWMVIAGKLRSNSLIIISCISLLSFVLFSYLQYYDPNLAFYLPITRVWELGAGALVAVLNFRHERRPSSRWQFMACMLGLLALVFMPKQVLGIETAFYALTVALTAGAIYFGLANQHISKALNQPAGIILKPIVYIGNVSYSLYLVHWPIIVFLSLSLDNDLLIQALSVPLMAVAAFLLYKYVETRFQSASKLNDPSVSIRTNSQLTAATVFCIVLAMEGLGSNSSPAGAGYLGLTVNLEQRRQETWGFFRGNPPYASRPFSEASGNNVVVLGDSHAKDMFNALNSVSRSNFETRALILDEQCILADQGLITDLPPDRLRKCSSDMLAARNSELIRHAELIIWASRWSEDKITHLPEILNWVSQLDRPIAVLAPTPEFDDLLSLMASARTLEALEKEMFASYTKQTPNIVNAFDSAIGNLSYPVIHKADFLCVQQTGSCKATFAGSSIYYDNFGHVSMSGARAIGGHLNTQIETLLNTGME